MDQRGGVGRCRCATGAPANRLPGRALWLDAGIVVGAGGLHRLRLPPVAAPRPLGLSPSKPLGFGCK